MQTCPQPEEPHQSLVTAFHVLYGGRVLCPAPGRLPQPLQAPEATAPAERGPDAHLCPPVALGSPGRVSVFTGRQFLNQRKASRSAVSINISPGGGEILKSVSGPSWVIPAVWGASLCSGGGRAGSRDTVWLGSWKRETCTPKCVNMRIYTPNYTYTPCKYVGIHTHHPTGMTF